MMRSEELGWQMKCTSCCLVKGRIHQHSKQRQEETHRDIRDALMLLRDVVLIHQH